MKRYAHQIAPPQEGYWKCISQTNEKLQFQVTNPQNQAGFKTFTLIRIDNKIQGRLDVRDKQSLELLSGALSAEITQQSGFFKGLKQGRAIHLTTGFFCQIDSDNIQNVEAMLFCMDKKLQFSQEHYGLIESSIQAFKDANCPSEHSCAIM